MRVITPSYFVADLHVLTDREPDVAIKYRKEVVSDYLGLAWIRIDATFHPIADRSPGIYSDELLASSDFS